MKVLVILGDGGHSTEMLRLVELLGPDYEYHYMMTTDDRVSEKKIVWSGPIYRVPKLLGKSPSERNPVRVIRPVLEHLHVLRQVRPQAILSIGANFAVPICVAGRLLGVRVIHVETGCRVFSMSSSGKLMYRVAHLFFVQWASLQKDYPKAVYAGRLL